MRCHLWKSIYLLPTKITTTKCKQQTRNDNSSLNVHFLDSSSILWQPWVISSKSILRKIITRLICQQQAFVVFNIAEITPCEQLYIVACLLGGLFFKADYSKWEAAISFLKSFQKFIRHLESVFSGVSCVWSVASLKDYPHCLQLFSFLQ